MLLSCVRFLVAIGAPFCHLTISVFLLLNVRCKRFLLLLSYKRFRSNASRENALSQKQTAHLAGRSGISARMASAPSAATG